MYYGDLVGGKIVDWILPSLIEVEKDGKKYEVDVGSWENGEIIVKELI